MRNRLKPIDGIFGFYTTRRLSLATTWISLKIGVSPNVLTVLSLISAFGASAILFLKLTSITWLILGALLVQLAGVLDASDGEVARLANKGTRFGAWLDSFTDRIKEFVYFAATGYFVLYTAKYNFYLVFTLMCLAIFNNIISGYITDTKKNLLKDQRARQFTIGRFYFGMTDTRDFFLIIAFVLQIFKVNGMFYLLILYGVGFIPAIIFQIFKSVKTIKRFDLEQKK